MSNQGNTPDQDKANLTEESWEIIWQDLDRQDYEDKKPGQLLREHIPAIVSAYEIWNYQKSTYYQRQ
jgi:hypothetical protein